MANQPTPVVEKKFYVLVDYAEDKWKKSEAWKQGDLIHLPQEEAQPYIDARILLPFKTAVMTGKYISPTAQTEPTPSTPKPEEKKSEEPEKKTILKNTLRDAVQTKKESTEKKDEEPETKKESPEDKKDSKSSAAEDAIKAKIAAAKAKKN